MAYPNRLGEFVVNRNSEDWPKQIRYIERRPVTGKGVFNPWETERQRVLWQAENDAWKKIVPLKAEYAQKEKVMKQNIAIFNSHLAELERVAGKKVGLGPIGTYGGMALAVIPGFGWTAAAFSAFSMIFEMIGGNKKKKRINELMRIMEDARVKMERAQKRLQAIVIELDALLQTTGNVQASQSAYAQAVKAKMEQDTLRRVSTDKASAKLYAAEVARYRQMNTNRVDYTSDDL